MYLICVDAHSKWMEIFHMKSTTADATIDKLQELFSSWGHPETIVSDSGPQFISDSFKQFCVRNGIVHLLSAPYNPSSNGLAERSVQSFKRALKAAMKDNPNLPISQAICNWLTEILLILILGDHQPN
jgi:transposase InsO family protein